MRSAVASCLLLLAHAYPDGYGTASCPGAVGGAARIPPHGAVSNLAGPYSLALSRRGVPVAGYGGGELNYTLRLAGGTFRGFILAALAGAAPQRFDAAPLGALAPVGAEAGQPMACAAGYTHTTSAAKTRAEWRWAPPAPGSGPVTFWAVVVTTGAGTHAQVRLVVPELLAAGASPSGSAAGTPPAAASPTPRGGGSDRYTAVLTPASRAVHFAAWVRGDPPRAHLELSAVGRTFLAWALSPGGLMLHDGSTAGSGPCVVGTVPAAALSADDDRGGGDDGGGGGDRAVEAGDVAVVLMRGKDARTAAVPLEPALVPAGTLLAPTITFNGSHTTMTWARDLGAPGHPSERPMAVGVASSFVWACAPAGDESGALVYHGLGANRGRHDVVLPAEARDGAPVVAGPAATATAAPAAAAPRASFSVQLLPGRLALSWQALEGGAAGGDGAATSGDVRMTLAFTGGAPLPTWFAVGLHPARPVMAGATAAVVTFPPGGAPGVVTAHALVGHAASPPAGGGSAPSPLLSGAAVEQAALPGGAWSARASFVWRGAPLHGAHVIYATGDDGDATLGGGHTTAARGGLRVAFASGEVARAAEPAVDLRVVHAALMSCGWAMLAAGVLAARFLRHAPGALWFKLHRGLQSAGAALVAAALAVAVAAAWLAGGAFAATLHGRVGVAVALLALTQPLTALARPSPPAKRGEPPTARRRVWALSHRAVGLAALLGSVPAALLGVAALRAPRAATIAGYALIGSASLLAAALALALEARMRWMGPKLQLLTPPPPPPAAAAAAASHAAPPPASAP